MSWGAAEYGDQWAAVYDRTRMRSQAETDEAVDALARLSRGARVLELGIGTGRLALPLAARGLDVHGIDASQAMVDQLRAKPGGDAIPVVIGDFADADADGRFDLVVLAFNTLFNLANQDAQCRCFANAARHLTEGGAFVVEAFVPDMRRFDGDQTVRALDVGDLNVVLEIARHDPVTQQVQSARVVIDDGAGIQVLPINIRYAWPSEIDLMARLAGLDLAERWGGWSGEPFTRDSRSHVSVYRCGQATESLS
ncbi:MAG: class I SAM-dependent DNA methyltransferase [Egibacteraceae bacterium]